jgi:hypothetical protein
MYGIPPTNRSPAPNIYTTMRHLMKYEAAGERLFGALEGGGVSGELGDRHRLRINKLTLKSSLRVFRVEGLRGTDPVSLGQAMRFLDLACDAIGVKPGETGVTVGFIFSRPGRPGELFYLEGVKVGALWGSTEFENLERALSEMDADIHMVSVKRSNYTPLTTISMYFLVDDWVQLRFRGVVKVGRDLTTSFFAVGAEHPTHHQLRLLYYRCDGLEGVRQCLGSLEMGDFRSDAAERI